MKEQRVLIIGNEYTSDVQNKLDDVMAQGWQVVSVTAQHVTTGSSQTIRGGYFIVFERDVADKTYSPTLPM
jgi:hypothetical protein